MNRKPSFVESPTVVLTGAGASVLLGKDTTKQFVQRCLESSQKAFLLQGILRSIKKRSRTSEVDIEMILDYLVELIGAYDILKSDEEIGPKIGSGGASFASRIAPITGLADAAGISEFINSPDYLISERRTLQEELLGFIVDHYCEVDDDAALRLYRPLFGADSFSFHPIPLFTLNYDVAVEAAVDASDGEFELVDGFPKNKSQRRWSPDVFRDYQPRHLGPTREIILFKLHGSTTWGRRKGSEIIVPLPLAQRRNPEPYEHVIMYPSQTKLGLEGEPFATAYSYFAECLENTRTCLVIGTSFRDREINKTFQEALRRSSKLHLVVVGPAVESALVSRILRCDESRITAIQGGFGDPMVYDAISKALL